MMLSGNSRSSFDKNQQRTGCMQVQLVGTGSHSEFALYKRENLSISTTASSLSGGSSESPVISSSAAWYSCSSRFAPMRGSSLALVIEFLDLPIKFDLLDLAPPVLSCWL